ncbi:MAG: class I SAM-dependent methyltransferase [Anaerolineae bacterium]|nr:class I SAM-dependent methyltransferase [Anaerolineae bacterium]
MTNNENLKISISQEHPINASTVNVDTPLEELNLNWSERDLPERERTKHVHRLHPYLGKYIPQLVEVFLRRYFLPGRTVLDPFCGSGTTLVQANELGINAVGFDVSAFNVLLCGVKTGRYDLAQARKEVLDILQKVRHVDGIQNRQMSLWDSYETASRLETESEYLKTWFAPEALQELLTYEHLIEAGGYEYPNLLKVILSRSARSARLTTHFDLDFPKKPQTEPYWCYKHSRICQPTTDALKFLHRYSLDTLKRIEEFAKKQTSAFTQVHHADSRSAFFPPVDGIVTSPPYVGLIDYHQQHAYAYHLLGLQDKHEDEIGAAADGSGQKAQRKYIEDIAAIFRRAAISMPANSPIIVVANDRKELYPEIAQLARMKVEATLERHVNRRTGRRSTEFYETIFIWRT